MAVNNSWRQPVTMNDWMRDIEKRLMHEERRPIPASATAVVGPGIGTYSRQVEDWNSEGPVVDGFFYSNADSVINSPDDSKNWMGLTQANSIGQGLQRVWEYIDTNQSPSPDPILYTRAFVTNPDGTRAYTPWLEGGGGGGGTGAITVQDEGVPVMETTQLDFIGAGVAATPGTGEVLVTIDGTPKGPAGGDLAGTYPNPTLSAAALSKARPEVYDEGTTIVTDMLGMDFVGPGVVVTTDGAGKAIVTIAGGGSGMAGVGQVGEMSLWGTNSPPMNWLFCQGQAISRTTYPDLFNVIGTTYGAGDGSTTFNLPNLKGKVPFGRDTGQAEFDVLGEVGGTKTHTHIANDHNHVLTVGGTIDRAAGAGTAAAANHTHGVGSASDWGMSTSSNLPPYLVINYIIRYQATAMAPGTVMVQEENAAVAAADIINFIGGGITATDAGGGKVNVTVLGGQTIAPVRVASPNGVNLTLSGTQTVDGVALVVGDRVLARQQSTATENAAYVVSAGAWTRAPDYPAAGTWARGSTVYVNEGNVNKFKTLTQGEPNPTTNGPQWDVVTYVDMGGAFSFPTPQGAGHLYYDQNSKALAVWDGLSWVRTGIPHVVTSTTRPSFVSDGVVIYETDTGRSYIWQGGAWRPFGGQQPILLQFPTPQTSWAGVHNLNQTPVDVTLMNAAGEEFFGNVSFPDANTAQVTFGLAVAGSMLIQK